LKITGVASRRGRRELSRPHRSGWRGDLGRREEVVRVPAGAFDVEFVPRGDTAAVVRCVGGDTAAVIVEPIQGVAGALDLGAPFLAALRKRCDETGALLIFDEVQCGMGRTGQPFAANLYGVTPDMITTAKALGAGFPCSALLLADHVAMHLRTDDLARRSAAGRSPAR
jgi:acetylornithine/succinyldiaminopimelate/putrescine aminotransferase